MARPKIKDIKHKAITVMVNRNNRTSTEHRHSRINTRAMALKLGLVDRADPMARVPPMDRDTASRLVMAARQETMVLPKVDTMADLAIMTTTSTISTAAATPEGTMAATTAVTNTLPHHSREVAMAVRLPRSGVESPCY